MLSFMFSIFEPDHKAIRPRSQMANPDLVRGIGMETAIGILRVHNT